MNVVIRTATAHDGAALAAIYAPYVTDTTVTFELQAPSPAEMGARIDRVTARFPWLVAERDGAAVGFAYAAEHRGRPAYRWACEVSVYVAAEQHGRGVGRALYQRLFEILTQLGLRRVYAGVAGVNPKSVALHRALGFDSVGTYRGVGFKHGGWHDTHWFQRSLGDPQAPPRGDPLPFADFSK